MRHRTGRRKLQAVLRDSQNSPSLVVPSPAETYTISLCLNWDARSSISLISEYRYPASAAPTACRNCGPVQEEREKMCSFGLLQCDGIWREPELGSSSAPTAPSNCSYGVMPSCKASARSL